eukprot:1475942-Rhodomonas_salina.2
MSMPSGKMRAMREEHQKTRFYARDNHFLTALCLFRSASSVRYPQAGPVAKEHVRQLLQICLRRRRFVLDVRFDGQCSMARETWNWGDAPFSLDDV